MQPRIAVHAHQQAQVNVLITLILILAAVVYVCGEFRSRGASRSEISAGRYVAFLCGLFTVWAAMASPLSTLDHQWLTAHMVKHLLLMTVAAPLILLGMTGSPLRFASALRRSEPNAGTSSRWSIAGYLFLATLPCDILSAFLVFCDRVIYPGYAAAQQPYGLSSLQDQQYAGALMWVWITFAYLLPAIIITMRLLGPGEAPSLSADATRTE